MSTFSLIIPALADHATRCGGVTLVFARGSGQELGEREAPAFFNSIDNHLGADVRVTRYELGTASRGGARYQPVGGWRDMLEAEASWTGILGGQYRTSVAAGVAELTNYLTQRARACPTELFVVGGYSQGAQVVGEALVELGSATRDHIAFVALFSDPKLHLPEGGGRFPSACRGESSPWRRGTVSCWTDSGILEARKPYLPEDVVGRTGSWCDRNDGTCNSNLADWALHDDHAEYADPGAEIDEAAREIADVLDDLLRDPDIDAPNTSCCVQDPTASTHSTSNDSGAHSANQPGRRTGPRTDRKHRTITPQRTPTRSGRLDLRRGCSTTALPASYEAPINP